MAYSDWAGSFQGSGKGFTSRARSYMSDFQDDVVKPRTPDLATGGTDSLANTLSTNFQTENAFASGGIRGVGESEKADQLVSYYKQKASDLNAQANKKNGVGGFLGGLLGLGSTIAGFIPGGQAVAAGLGVAAKGASYI